MSTVQVEKEGPMASHYVFRILTHQPHQFIFAIMGEFSEKKRIHKAGWIFQAPFILGKPPPDDKGRAQVILVAVQLR